MERCIRRGAFGPGSVRADTPSQIYIGSFFKTILENYFSYSFFKPSPRDTDNQELLWEAVLAGHIDMIVSDHSPCTPGFNQKYKYNFF